MDYPKSGNPVEIQQIPKLRFHQRPDWNAPETVNPDSSKYYPSSRAIGRLFRDIDLPATPGSRKEAKKSRLPEERTTNKLSNALANLAVTNEDDDSIQGIVKEHVSQFIDVGEASSTEKIGYTQSLFRRYVAELRTICASYTLSHAKSSSLSEEEAVVGTIIQKSSQPRKRNSTMSKLREHTDTLVRSVREELAGDAEMPPEEFLARAWLAWKLSILEWESFGSRSFWWLTLGAVFEAIKEVEVARLEDSHSRFY